jgi:hypothetical protein
VQRGGSQTLACRFTLGYDVKLPMADAKTFE